MFSCWYFSLFRLANRERKKEPVVADTLSVTVEPVRSVEPSLVAGSVTLSEDDLVQSCGSARGTAYLYETTASKLYAADTTGTLKSVPVKFEAIKGSSYSSKQIVMAAPDTLYSVDNVRGGKALFRMVLQGDSTVTEQIYNLSFSKKHKGWAAYIGDFLYVLPEDVLRGQQAL